VLGPDGARLAKRHGAVTLRDVGADAARRWIWRSVGLDPGDPVGSFDPVSLPTEPTIYEPD
jgi:glutamyl-tRNA synthetase